MATSFFNSSTVASSSVTLALRLRPSSLDWDRAVGDGCQKPLMGGTTIHGIGLLGRWGSLAEKRAEEPTPDAGEGARELPLDDSLSRVIVTF